MPHRSPPSRTPVALLAAALAAALLAAPAAADTASYNNQTADLNALAPLFKRVDDKEVPDPAGRVAALLEARKLLDACVARGTPHPGLEPALKRYGELKKRLCDEFFNAANAHLNETDHTKSLKFIRLLLKIAPEEQAYKTWEANLTRRDLETRHARLYAGGEDPQASYSTLRGNEVKELLDRAFVEFQFRYFAAAKKLYQEAQRKEPGNIEAERRLERIALLSPMLDEIERLSAHVDSLRRSYGIGGYDRAKFDEVRPRFDKLDAADPDFRLRGDLYAPETPPVIAAIELEHDQRKINWGRRTTELKEMHLRHLYHAAIARIALRDGAGAARCLAALEAADRDSLYAIEIRIFVDDAAGRPLDALRKLREYMRARGFASNAVSLYGRAAFNLGSPEYAFVLSNHFRLYTKLYWPLELLLAAIAAGIAWSGSRTYRLWDEVTDGLITRILTLSNKTPMEYFDSANACVAARKLEKAVKHFTKALDIDKGFAEAYLGRAMARLELDDAEGARTDLETHVKLRPGNNRSLYHLAVCYDRLGRREEAIVTIEQAIGLGLQMREFKIDEAAKNKALYRRVMNDYLKNAETLLAVKPVARASPAGEADRA